MVQYWEILRVCTIFIHIFGGYMARDITKIRYHETILGTIGHTPLVKLSKVTKGIKATILAKVESFNPGGSVKDRIGLNMIEEAELDGRLKPGGTIVEATSGNTGMGLALAAAVKGYRCVFTMPDKMSQEKINILRALGAEVIVTPTAVEHDSPESYTEVAKKVVRETPNSMLANQYYNPKNPEAHYKTTGPELWEQTGGQIDYFICGLGTGGTISGTGKYLKEKDPSIKVIGVDPKGSILKEYFYTKKFTPVFKTYKVEGIGQDVVPGVLNFDYVDDVVEADDKESFLMGRRLAREEGLLVGGSAGTAVAGALRFAENLGPDDIVVVLLPDTGERYISKMYNDEWMLANRFLVPERITLRYVMDNKSELKEVVSVTPEATVRSALDVLVKNNISQAPVMENGSCLGSIDESEVMSSVITDPSRLEAPIRSIMKAPYPIVNKDEPIQKAIDHLSRKHPAVLLEDDGKITGIVTKFDVLEHLSR